MLIQSPDDDEVGEYEESEATSYSQTQTSHTYSESVDDDHLSPKWVDEHRYVSSHERPRPHHSSTTHRHSSNKAKGGTHKCGGSKQKATQKASRIPTPAAHAQNSRAAYPLHRKQAVSSKPKGQVLLERAMHVKQPPPTSKFRKSQAGPASGKRMYVSHASPLIGNAGTYTVEHRQSANAGK